MVKKHKKVGVPYLPYRRALRCETLSEHYEKTRLHYSFILHNENICACGDLRCEVRLHRYKSGK